MLVLKTTSPAFSPKNPKDPPSNTAPSSKANRAFRRDFIRGSLIFLVASAFTADGPYAPSKWGRYATQQYPHKKRPPIPIKQDRGPLSCLAGLIIQKLFLVHSKFLNPPLTLPSPLGGEG